MTIHPSVNRRRNPPGCARQGIHFWGSWESNSRKVFQGLGLFFFLGIIYAIYLSMHLQIMTGGSLVGGAAANKHAGSECSLTIPCYANIRVIIRELVGRASELHKFMPVGLRLCFRHSIH